MNVTEVCSYLCSLKVVFDGINRVLERKDNRFESRKQKAGREELEQSLGFTSNHFQQNNKS